MHWLDILCSGRWPEPDCRRQHTIAEVRFLRCPHIPPLISSVSSDSYQISDDMTKPSFDVVYSHYGEVVMGPFTEYLHMIYREAYISQCYYLLINFSAPEEHERRALKPDIEIESKSASHMPP